MSPNVLFQRFLDDRKDLRATTRTAYRVELQRLGDMADCPIRNLRPQHLERWAGNDQLRRRTMRVLKTICNWGVRVGLLESNPIAAVRGPRVVTRTHVPFAGSVLGLWREFRTHRDQTLVRLLIDSGLRAREALALDWQDVDLELGMLRVHRSVDPKGRFQPLKVLGSDREIAITPQTVAMLKKLPREEGPVFRNRFGTRIDLHNWHSRIWLPVVRRLGLKLRIHDLRHLCGTTLVEAGLPLAAVQQRLGHKSIQTTIQFYTRKSSKLSRQAADAMSGLLGD